MAQITSDIQNDGAREERHEKVPGSRAPEVVALILGVVAGVALLGGRYLDALGADGVSFLAVSVLFLVPGFLLWSWFLKDGFPGLSGVPVWFVLSISVFCISGTPFLILQTPPSYYSVFCALLVAGFLLAALVRLFVKPGSRLLRERDEEESQRVSVWLFVPFALISGLLAYLSWIKVPEIYGDLWVYLSWINNLANENRLALTEPYFGSVIEASRARFNGWLLMQANFSRATGIEPETLLPRYLNPTFVVVSLLSVYALARTVIRNSNAAIFAASLYGILMLYYMGVSVLPFGGEFAGRIVEDKYAARYLFLPVALALAVRFAQDRRAAYAVMFALLCWASVTIHPVGIAIIGLSMAGFAVAHVLVNFRRLRAYTTMATLAASASTVLLIPLVYVASTGNALATVLEDADINSGDPDVLANMVFARPGRRRILEFADGSFIMHPYLILTPVILVALIVGVPFLLSRIRDGRTGVGAQLLAGSLILVTGAVYIPPVATFMGDHVVVPGQLWRLAWPIPLVSIITLGWLGWWIVSKLSSIGSLASLGRRLAPALCAFVLVLIVSFYYPQIKSGAEEVITFRESGDSRPDPFDPAYDWIRANVTSPSVILAPDAENTAIPAYSSDATVVSRRGNLVVDVLPALEERAPGQIDVPLGSYQVRYFFSSPYIDEQKVEILRQRNVDYIMLRSEWQPMIERLERSPGFEKVDRPESRYTIFRVEPEEVRPSD